jgi:protein-disulfide isomerase
MSDSVNISIKKSHLQIGALLIAAFLFGYLVSGANNIPAPTGNAVNNPSPSGNTAPTVDLSGVELEHVLGDKDAPVTIIEFSDYQCPFCKKFYAETLPQIKSNYIDTGKVKFVYKDFPLSFHQMAQKSAEAAECAGEQGLYFEMHDKIFEGQSILSLDNLKIWASEIDGIDVEQFNNCLDNGDYEAEVKADMIEGQQVGVTGTPGFFINGQKIVGAQPYSVFEAAIEAALAS